MTKTSRAAWHIAAIPGAILVAFLLLQTASSQIPPPPSTVFGSISDADGEVPEGLPVEAYIGDVQCGSKGGTVFSGEGSSRVTAYIVTVVSDGQKPGCGKEGANQEIRLKIGDRFADETAIWSTGPVRVDITFGNATPVPLPTLTPTPTRTPGPATTPQPGGTTTGGQGGDGQVATIPPGSPGAGSPVATQPQGGITSEDPGQGGSGGGDDGGVPVWAIVLLVLGGVGVVGGGVGYMMSRSQKDAADAEFFAPDEPYPPAE